MGGSGFIGRAVRQAAGDARVVDIAFRCHGAWRPDDRPSSCVERWIKANPQICDRVAGQLSGVDVVINAAGSAAPGSNRSTALFDANALLPGVIATLAARAGVARMVHISSAAVQGSRSVLDESAQCAPVTAYGRSKAAGEAILTDGSVSVPGQVVLYRPTSVQAVERPITRQLVRLAGGNLLPVVGDGETPLPLCLVQNVAAGVVCSAICDRFAPVVLQPWEGVTTRLLWELFGRWPGMVSLPARPIRWAVGALLGVGAVAAPAGALGRRLEMLLLGQQQQAAALQASGFAAPVGLDGYRRLADQVRLR